MSIAEFDADVVVDAADCILGRVASEVAQRAMDGERVAVVNAEDAVITGRRESVMEKYRDRARIGSDRGPAYPRRPDGIFKRAVRGMVPHKTDRGRAAFERVRVYVGNPHDYDAERLDDTTLNRLSTIRFVALGDISEQLGANVTW
jgi:large subunit ribosomal protein L13